jgi:hypothetical protein
MSRPVLPWRSPLVLLPPDSALVWIRRLPWYDTPVRSQFALPTEFYVTTVVGETGRDPQDQIVPVYMVHTWKFQFKADEDAYQAARLPGWPH